MPRGRCSTRSRRASTTSWDVFHSAAWVVRDKSTGSKDGEIDFVLVHPEEGVLCLEVKGGGIECRHGEWFGIHSGKSERIKDPFTQALDHTYALRRKIGGMPAKGGGDLLIGHAVAFPDISVHKLVLAPDAPPELIIDRNQMATVDESVERILAYHRGAGSGGGPGSCGREEASGPAGSLRADRGADGGGVPRRGGADDHPHPRSSAAAPHVRPRAPDGRHRPCRLGQDDARRRAGEGAWPPTTRRCSSSASTAGCATTSASERRTPASPSTPSTASAWHWRRRRRSRYRPMAAPIRPPTTGSEELPLALLSAIEELGPQYDALFVDEAQDLSADWLDGADEHPPRARQGARLALHG